MKDHLKLFKTKEEYNNFLKDSSEYPSVYLIEETNRLIINNAPNIKYEYVDLGLPSGLK